MLKMARADERVNRTGGSMMFLIGQGERTVVIGPAQPHYCPRCEAQSEFIPQLKYSYGEFDLLFGFVYNKRYQLVCPQCSHG